MKTQCFRDFIPAGMYCSTESKVLLSMVDVALFSLYKIVFFGHGHFTVVENEHFFHSSSFDVACVTALQLHQL